MYTYRVGGILITDELYHDDLESMTFGRKTQDELWHHGIKGMQWDKRRFQNEDGTLTMAGRQRYGVGNPKIGMNVEIADGGDGNARAGAAAAQRAKSANYASRKPSYNQVNKPTPQYNMNRTRTAVSDAGSRPASRNSVGFTARNTAYKVGQSAAKGRMAADRLFNNVRDAVTTASGNVAKTATGVYDNAGKWLNQAGQDIAKTATNAYDGAGKWVNQAGQDIAKTATNAYDGAGKWLNQAGQDIAKTATGVYDNAGKWLNQAGQNIAETATNAYNGASDWIDQNITGNSAREYASLLNNIADNTPRSDPEILNKLRNEANEEQAKADNSLLGRIGNAANAVGDWAKGAYENARDWTTGAVNDAGKWVTGAYNDVRDFIGNDVGIGARDRANNANIASTQAYQKGNEHLGERLANEAGRQQNIAENSLLGRIGNWATNAYGDARDYVNEAGQKFAKTPTGQWLNKAGQDISTAAGNVGKVVTDAYNLASNYSSDPTVRAYLAQMSDPNMDPAQKLEIANVMTDYINSQKSSNSVANAAKAVGSAAKDLRDQVTNYRYDPQVQYYQSMLARPDLDSSTRVDIEREMNAYIDSLKKR